MLLCRQRRLDLKDCWQWGSGEGGWLARIACRHCGGILQKAGEWNLVRVSRSTFRSDKMVSLIKWTMENVPSMRLMARF